MIDRRSSPIDPAVRALITTCVPQINGCSFCVDINSATLLMCGTPPVKIEALSRWPESNLFDERERAALDYAKTMTHSGREAGGDLCTRLREHFDDDAIAELTGLIAFQNMSSKFNGALGVPPQGFCRLPGDGSMDSLRHRTWQA